VTIVIHGNGEMDRNNESSKAIKQFLTININKINGEMK